MTRRHCLRSALILVAAAVAGCDYGASKQRIPVSGRSNNLLPDQITSGLPYTRSKPASSGSDRAAEAHHETVLKSVIQLIVTANESSSGKNYDTAVQLLGEYFAGYEPSRFAMSAPAREYLKARLGDQAIKELEDSTWVARRDGAHVADCLLYHTIAARVAGSGDDLSRVRNIFDWVVRHVQLVPEGAFAMPGPNGTLAVAQARPADVLIRGMAVERDGAWAERSWVFMALCRQIGIDVGLLAYTPRGRQPTEQNAWACVAVVDRQAYLFDARLGLPVPGPDGTGVATVEQAATDPAVLARFDLPGQIPYRVGQGDLAAGKLYVLYDASTGYASPRMRLLQESLAGKDRMLLFRDPAEQRDAFAAALGDRLGSVEPWRLPMYIEYQLFTNPTFVDASQYALRYFKPQFPLLLARLAQLRGQQTEAMQTYATSRFDSKLTLRDKKTLIPDEIRRGLDMYFTYFLALGHLEKGDLDNAEFLLTQALKNLPEPADGQPPVNMFRWGANANLARIYEERGKLPLAIAHYCQPDPTWQFQGNLVRATDLLWRDPLSPLPPVLPPAPKPDSGPETAAR